MNVDACLKPKCRVSRALWFLRGPRKRNVPEAPAGYCTAVAVQPASRAALQ